MSIDSETQGIIDNLLSNNKVVLFMKGTPDQPQCGFSAKTIATLDLLTSTFMAVNVLEYPEIREGIKEHSNWPTIPQLYIDGELIGGNDIVQDMLKSGELATALGVDIPTTTQPEITISPDGIALIKSALDAEKTGNLQLQISATWTHQMSLDDNPENDICVDIDGLKLYMDPWTAGRADGLQMTLEKGMTGSRFIFDNPNAPPPVNQMTVQTLKTRLDSGDDIVLIDVRENSEQENTTITGARLWNSDTRTFIESLPKDTEIIIHCHLGDNSQTLADTLRQHGYTNLHNLAGGIKAWTEATDNS
ncbi:MAG: Grx4 family monothiol glutaredoxin [Gammaproteobacteria bacterium]|nr:Grx4 family monothiol glutaredoxin [Gammaproteobacteria bacterium]